MFAYFCSLPSLVLTSILLVDMGESFGQPVGVMAQMQTLSSLVGTLSAFAVGILCVRYNAKAILLAGLAVLGLSALGCGSAPTLSILLIFYALTGLGMAMVDPMVGALTADFFDVDERARVIGLTGAGGGLSYILGSLVIGYVASVSGWRTAFLGYAMVLPLLGALLSHMALPSTGKSPSGGGGAIESFREIYSNRSAMACLLGNLLTSAMAQGIYVYSFSFLRERFMVAPGWTGVVSSAPCRVTSKPAIGSSAEKRQETATAPPRRVACICVKTMPTLASMGQPISASRWVASPGSRYTP